MRVFKALAMAAVTTVGLASMSAQAANTERSLCVFDIIGASGDVYNIMKDYKTEAAGWGVDIKLKPYTDEKIAAEDLKAGQCDGAVLTGLRVRQSRMATVSSSASSTRSSAERNPPMAR